MGQDLNHNTLKQHLYDYNLSAGLDWQGGKHLENTHTLSWCVPPRLFKGPQCRLSVWITRWFVFTPVVLCSVWTTNGRELVNHHCGVSVWKGLLVTHRAGSGLEVVSRFYLLTPWNRFVDLSVAICFNTSIVSALVQRYWFIDRKRSQNKKQNEQKSCTLPTSQWGSKLQVAYYHWF